MGKTSFCKILKITKAINWPSAHVAKDVPMDVPVPNMRVQIFQRQPLRQPPWPRHACTYKLLFFRRLSLKFVFIYYTLSDLSVSVECQADCIEEAKQCYTDCSGQDCTSICIERLTQCDADCPCNENCPRKVSFFWINS